MALPFRPLEKINFYIFDTIGNKFDICLPKKLRLAFENGVPPPGYDTFVEGTLVELNIGWMHSPTGAPAPAKTRPFLHPPAPVKIPNGRRVFAGFYLFLLEKEPRRHVGKARP